MTIAKKIISIIIGAILILTIGIIISIPIHNWTADYFPIEGSDDEVRFLKFVVFVEWPFFLILGGIIGNKVYKKYLSG